jgi:hypothetical protein
MWSLGCIAVELFLGLPLFPGTSEYNQISRIVEMLGCVCRYVSWLTGFVLISVPPSFMLEFGKNGNQYFNRTIDPSTNKAHWSLKPMEQYCAVRFRSQSNCLIRTWCRKRMWWRNRPSAISKRGLFESWFSNTPWAESWYPSRTLKKRSIIVKYFWILLPDYWPWIRWNAGLHNKQNTIHSSQSNLGQVRTHRTHFNEIADRVTPM